MVDQAGAVAACREGWQGQHFFVYCPVSSPTSQHLRFLVPGLLHPDIVFVTGRAWRIHLQSAPHSCIACNGSLTEAVRLKSIYMKLPAQQPGLKNKMKILHSITAILIVLTVFACSKKLDLDPGTSATVVIDCTGTYLQWDGKDYKVCNLEKVFAFQSGATVKVDVKKTEGCSHPGNLASACYMLHKFESWVEVQNIKGD